MTFEVDADVRVRRDDKGRVRHLHHPTKLYEPEAAEGIVGFAPPTAQSLANAYLKEVTDVYDFGTDTLETLTEPSSNGGTDDGDGITDESSRLRYANTKSTGNTTTIAYEQTALGLPVWRSGVTVRVREDSMGVTSSDSTFDPEVTVERSNEDDNYGPDDIDIETLRELLVLDDEYAVESINDTRRIVYRYDSSARTDTHDEDSDVSFEESLPTLDLPAVADAIEDEKYYVVTEVLFTLAMPEGYDLNWRTLIEPVSGAVLYLRALTTGWTGSVFAPDPVTATGDTTITPGSSSSVLNPLRTSVTLDGLDSPSPGDPVGLDGDTIDIEELENPIDAGPTRTSGDFDYDARTDDFSAVNAYYHCGRLYQLMEDLGFDVGEFFDGTTFPIPVDHRGFGGSVNARAPGNTHGTGLEAYHFGLASPGQPVGIATAWRVIIHEFGHALLWDHVHSPNFGFAHSAGDSLAAILNDPESRLRGGVDRFKTFPWAFSGNLGRRHDRAVADGWAWDGPRDIGGYSSEQILSTTLFRAYRALGGDSDNTEMRQWAARYMAYLIVYAISTLTPTNRANHADEFAAALIEADVSTLRFDGHRGSVAQKVLDWAFNEQKQFPANQPERDVYIDDGRNGGYEYRTSFTPEIWNRLQPDGGTTHQSLPWFQLFGTGYAYVRVRNQGTQPVTDVTVRCYQSDPVAGSVWPNDWTPVDTRKHTIRTISAGGQQVVGPFQWDIRSGRDLLMVVEAAGDRSIATFPGSLPTDRLTLLDNNAANRTVYREPFPIPRRIPRPIPRRIPRLPGTVESWLFGRVRSETNGFQVEVQNPFDRTVDAEFACELPVFLRERGWEVEPTTAIGSSLTLGPRERRRVQLNLVPGDPVRRSEVGHAQTDTVQVNLIADGMAVGSVSHVL